MTSSRVWLLKMTCRMHTVYAIKKVIVGWLKMGFSDDTDVRTHIRIHTQLLTSWSSLVLS